MVELEYISEYIYSVYSSPWNQVLAISVIIPCLSWDNCHSKQDNIQAHKNTIHTLTYNHTQKLNHTYSNKQSLKQITEKLNQNRKNIKNKNVWKYENIKTYKYGNIQIYMQKNINAKNVKGCIKKVNTYMKKYKVTSNRNVNKETNKHNKEKMYKNSKYIEMCIKMYENIYIQTRKYTNI